MLGNTSSIQHLQKVDQVEANTHTAGTRRRTVCARVCVCVSTESGLVHVRGLLTDKEDSSGQQQVRGQGESVGDAQEENCQQESVSDTCNVWSCVSHSD